MILDKNLRFLHPMIIALLVALTVKKLFAVLEQILFYI